MKPFRLFLCAVLSVGGGLCPSWLRAQAPGTVVAWGSNESGKATVPPGLSGVKAVAGGDNFSLALKTDGTVVAWGSNGFGQATVPAGLTGVKAIAAGYQHALALKNDGTVVAWGYNNAGQTNVPPDLTGVVAISAGLGGSTSSMALKNDGTVVIWGETAGGHTVVPAGLTGVKIIATGGGHCVVVKTDGTLVAWGDNSRGQTNIPVGLSGVIDLGASDVNNLALKQDGTVVAWGQVYYGQQWGPPDPPAGLNEIAAIAPGRMHSLAIRNDGTLVGWGRDVEGDTIIPAGLSGVVAVSACFTHSLALQGVAAETGFNPGAGGEISALVVQPDGKLIVGGGFNTVAGEARNYLARLNEDGTIDGDFNPDPDYTISSAALQDDGKIIIGGAFFGIGGIPQSYLARLHPGGALDTDFAPLPDNTPFSMVVQTDGKIIVAGSFTHFGEEMRNHLARLHADGTLDAGFNPNVNGDVFSIARQADGKILLGGDFTSAGGTVRNYIARINPDGSLDSSFNPAANQNVQSVAVQADGKVLLGGGFSMMGGIARSRLARVNADGSLDAAFNPVVNGDVSSISVQVDGKVLISGTFTSIGGIPRYRVARLEADGSVDAGCNPGANSAVGGLTVQANGKIVTGGLFTTMGAQPRSHLARLANHPATHSLTVPEPGRVQWLRGGSSPEVVEVKFETSMDGGTNWTPLGSGTRMAGGWERTGVSLPGNGQVRARARTSGGQYNGSSSIVEEVTPFSFLNVNSEASGAVVQPDGKFVVCGSFTSVGSTVLNHLARFHANGTLDTSFNPHANSSVAAAAVQTDGKIVIGGGFSAVGGATRNSIARLNADGTIDGEFNKSRGPDLAPDANGTVNSIAVQPDGKIVLGGAFTNVNGAARKSCARLNVDGTLDTAVNLNVNGAVHSVAVQADGKIVIGGAFTAVGSARNGLARLNSTGALDTAFNPNVTGGIVSCVAVQADGKVLLGGTFNSVAGTGRNRIARVNADGTLDTGFDPNANGTVTGIAVQADGKILLGGAFTTVAGVTRNRIARLNAGGSLDSFNPGANGSVSHITLLADGRILAGGTFTSIAGTPTSFLARLDNDAVTGGLTIPDFTRVQWLRGGSVPESQFVTFEQSTDGGTVWNLVGAGTRISGGWERTGLNLFGSGQIRARARTAGGQFSGSSGIVETVAAFSGLVPEIVVEQPPGADVPHSGARNFGNVVLGSDTALQFTVRNTGPVPLTGIGLVIDGPQSSDFTVTAAPPVSLGTSGASTTFSVRFTPGAPGARTATLHLANNDPDENPFDIVLTGTGLVAGQLDAGFSVSALAPGGIYTGGSVSALAVQPDGKVILGGQFNLPPFQGAHPVMRVSADGVMEGMFSTNAGVVGATSAINLQMDGKVALGGVFQAVSGSPNFSLTRLLPDGTRESTPSFDAGPGNEFLGVNGMAIQPDGKFLVAQGGNPSRIVRLEPNGSLESAATFVQGSPNAGFPIDCVALQPDGKILLGGNFNTFNGQSRSCLARLNPDGTLESTATFNPGSIINGSVRCVAVQPDGKILIGGGFLHVGGQQRNRIARLYPDGSLESTTTFNPGEGLPGTFDSVRSLALQADGKILVGGSFTSFSGQLRMGIARLHPNGNQESSASFNPPEISRTPSPSNVSGVALQADGRILIGGDFDNVGGQQRIGVARLVNQKAVQVLAVPHTGQITWMRSGTAPEVSQVFFDVSANGGANWIALGAGLRVAGGWELAGANLPPGGQVRARGRTIGGWNNGSSGIVEQVADYTATPAPEISVEQPAGNNLSNGAAVDIGKVGIGSGVSRTFMIRNPGYAMLTGLGITIDGPDAARFSLPASPAATLSGPDGSTSFTVQFTPQAVGTRTATLHIASNDADENPFNIILTGRDASTNANLSALTLSAGALTPTFVPATTAYSLNVPYSTASTTITPTVADANAVVRVNGSLVASGIAGSPLSLNVGANVITALVTAEDETTYRTYTLTVNRAAPVEGELDPVFNPNVTGTAVLAAVVQPDGKMLLGGDFSAVGGFTRTNLARLHADGSVESTNTFNPGSGPNGAVHCVAVQPDGKILLGGFFGTVNGQSRNCLARLLADGSVESLLTFNPGTGPNNKIRCLALQPDGKILIGGEFSSVNSQPRNRIARLHPDGTVESIATFNPGTGISHSGTAVVFSIALQPDGKIVVGGQFDAVNGLPRKYLARLHGDGTVEDTATFNNGTGPDEFVNCVAVQPDGKILVGGQFQNMDGQIRKRIARLLPNGTVESNDTFAPQGGADSGVGTIIHQADGKILVGGGFAYFGGSPNSPRGRMARLHANGNPESTATFNTGTGANAPIQSLALLADGSILVAGSFTTMNGTPRNLVARLANGAATQTLAVPDNSRVIWTRGGTLSTTSMVTFALSTNGGSSWSPLGFGSVAGNGWERTALNLPSTGLIRASALTLAGSGNGSSGFVEYVAPFINEPALTTGAATAISTNSAVLNGTLNPNGAVTAFFEYGLSTAYGSSTAGQSAAGGNAVNVQAPVAGLEPNALYHCRLVAVHPGGAYYGQDVAFTTAPDPPVVATSTPATVTGSGATLVGAVNTKGRATNAWFEWGSTTLYGSTTPVQNIPAGGSTVNILAPVTGLLLNGTYHYRIVAVNSGGSASGADVSFQAGGGGSATAPPSVSTGAVTNLTTTDVTFNGTVNPNGGFTNAYFEYGTTTAYGGTSLALGAGSGSVPGNVSVGVSGLTPGTLYHYRLVAANSLGTVSGNDATFTTSFPPPLVTTGGASALSTTSARVNGIARARNAGTQVFFDYGTDGVTFPNSASATPATVTGDTDTAVSADLTLLSQGLTYHYRLRAVSAGGTASGATATLVLDILSGLTRLFPLAPPPAQGMLTVNIGPVDIGAGWRLAGEQEWRAPGSTAGALTTSDREVEFRPVPGYIQPPRETVSIVSGGETTVFDTFYHATPVAGSGGFSLTLKPDAIATASVPAAERAQWRLSGEVLWRDSGTTVGTLFPGNYLVECKTVAGRTTPPQATVVVVDGQTSLVTLTYFLADAQTGTLPDVLEFAAVSTSQNLPYAHVGQIRSDTGLSSGFAVKQRVVGTAGHVVWNDGTLSAVTGLQWLFQRDRGTYEPKPQIPRGFYLFDGYAAARAAPGVIPGEGTPASQNLDVAALYFLEGAGRGGFSGFLASDLPGNEFLLSSAQKILVGYPVDGIPLLDRGRMHATPAMNVPFSQGFGRTYTTTAIRASGGASGGPLCVQYQGGNYYPGAVYLGGSAQTVVRAIDSAVIDLFNRAEVSGGGGSNNTGGGITHTIVTGTLNIAQSGSLRVLIEPAAARAAGAGWRLNPETNYRAPHSATSSLGSLTPGTRTLEFKTVNGFPAPSPQPITITGGQLLEVTFSYEPLDVWRLTNFGTLANSGPAANNADPDKDGLENLVEYAFGLNPNLASSAQLPQWLRTGGNYTLTFTLPAGASGVTCIAEQSSSLGAADWTAVSNQGTPPHYQFTVPVSAASRKFLRLRITSP